MRRERGKTRRFPVELAPENERMDGPQSGRFGSRVATEPRGRVAPSHLDAQVFAARLTRALEELKISLDDVANRMKHPLRQVKQWTTAQKPTIPDPAILMRIARVFGISPTYLLLGAGPMLLSELQPGGDAASSLESVLAGRLRSRGHSEEEITAIIERDGDVLERLVAVYALRLRLAPMAALLGLSPEELEFAEREVEMRLVIGPPNRKRKTATRLAAERYLDAAGKGGAKKRQRR